ncbi:MAG TPA: hypothetical protein VGG48_05280 [Rhizomicrobium sp.]
MALLATSDFASAAPAAQADHIATFCGFNEGKSGESGVTRFDFSKRVELGSDAAAHFLVVQNEVAVGIDGDLPLSLPKKHISLGTGQSLRWHLGDFEYTATAPGAADNDWLLIHAQQLPADAGLHAGEKFSVRQSSSILYSQSGGVLAIRDVRIVDGKVYPSEMRACGAQRIIPAWFVEQR